MERAHENTIVLVDDDPLFLDETGRLLEESRYAVRLCPRPAVAHRLIKRIQPDAVLLDQDMPEICGLDVLRQIRGFSATVTIPVLFLTAHDNRALRIEGFESGLDDFIAKPFEGRELLLRLRAILRRSRRRSASPLADEGEASTRENYFGERAILLQIRGYQKLAGSEFASLRPRVDRVLALLFHRLRDLLAGGRELHPAAVGFRKTGDEEILLYIPAHSAAIGSDRHSGRAPETGILPSPVAMKPEGLRRLVAAGNRLLGRHFRGSHFLRSGIRGPLIREPLPIFRIFDFRIAGSERHDLALPGRVARLELERPHREGETHYRRFDL